MTAWEYQSSPDERPSAAILSGLDQLDSVEHQGPVEVLVVEDEPLIARDLKSRLERLGYRVPAVVSTGEAAIAEAERHLPDLAIMDIRLAGEMDGIAAGAVIRNELRIPIVYLTAMADEQTFREVKKSSDPFGFLLKPYQERDLHTTVEVALYRHRTERNLREAKRRLETHARRQAAVAEIGLQALRGGSLVGLMQRAVELTAQMMDADLCAVVRYSEEHEALFLTAGIGWRHGAIGSIRMEADETQYGYALSACVPVVVGGREPSEHKSPAVIEEYGMSSGVALSIGEDRAWGVMGVHTKEPRWFTEEDLHFLQAVVNVLSTAVERERREALIRDLSTPVLPIREGLLMVPLIGEMDAERVGHLTETLLRAVRDRRARWVVLDVTGLGSMNALLAQKLLQTAEAAKLMGSEVIMTGVSPLLAETIVMFGMDFGRIRTAHDLREGIETASYYLDSRPRPS